MQCSFLPKFRNKISVPFSRFKNPNSFLDSWTLMMAPICCPETSVRNYYYTLRNSQEGLLFRLIQLLANLVLDKQEHRQRTYGKTVFTWTMTCKLPRAFLFCLGKQHSFVRETICYVCFRVRNYPFLPTPCTNNGQSPRQQTVSTLSQTTANRFWTSSQRRYVKTTILTLKWTMQARQVDFTRLGNKI